MVQVTYRHCGWFLNIHSIGKVDTFLSRRLGAVLWREITFLIARCVNIVITTNIIITIIIYAMLNVRQVVFAGVSTVIIGFTALFIITGTRGITYKPNLLSESKACVWIRKSNVAELKWTKAKTEHM